VPLSEPGWWYADTRGGTRFARLLAPVGDLYGALVERRFEAAAPAPSDLPVICVGNFTAGGTGKTPLTRFLTGVLAARGIKPVVLSRGYGGTLSGPVWVDGAHHRAREVGDEPLLIASDVPVMVARDRKAGLEAIVADSRADAVVMDDGLQNPSLAKALSIAVVDARRGVGNGLVIPAGPLRARLSFQLGLVDCIVVMGDDPPGPAIFDALKSGFPGPVLRGRVAPTGDASWLADRMVLAYAGIANPERFFATLERLGPRAVLRRPFGDHHAFTEREAAALVREAEEANALLVTTEKDLARLKGLSGACEALARASRVLPIAVTFEDRDLVRLEALLDGVLKTVSQRR
jgi:tetraacyldisaccharide 4'-kinase